MISARNKISGAARGEGNVIPLKRIRAERRTCIVGGDSPEAGGEEVPTIVIEKDNDGNIARILVRCPCGRSAELVCSYD